jgi:hypothetical protein
MLFPTLEERVQQAKHALDRATSDNIVELCQQYLTRLAEYRTELYKLPDTLDFKHWTGPAVWEDVDNIRRAIRVVIENTTRARTDTEALLRSFTVVSGYEAVATFNRRKYRGYADWELRAGGVVRFSGDIVGERLTIQEAVATASLLRREEYIARRAARGVNPPTSLGLSPVEPRSTSEGSGH